MKQTRGVRGGALLAAVAGGAVVGVVPALLELDAVAPVVAADVSTLALGRLVRAVGCAKSISAVEYHGRVVWRPALDVVHAPLEPVVAASGDATATTFRLPWLLW